MEDMWFQHSYHEVRSHFIAYNTLLVQQITTEIPYTVEIQNRHIQRDKEMGVDWIALRGGGGYIK